MYTDDRHKEMLPFVAILDFRKALKQNPALEYAHGFHGSIYLKQIARSDADRTAIRTKAVFTCNGEFSVKILLAVVEAVTACGKAEPLMHPGFSSAQNVCCSHRLSVRGCFEMG